jgi:2-oxoisovalerate dehydrogenase E1 component alpha subunit
MLEALSRADAPWSGGRQMPSHFADPKLKILSSSSVVATQIVHAVGAALAAKVRGDGAVAITYFGEGATSEGAFHEALNCAAVWKLPVVLFCENNGLAVSVPLERQMPIRTVADRAAAYDIPGLRIDGLDLLAVYETTSRAVERALHGQGPTLIDAHVSRPTPHSSDDDHARYRTAEEIELARRNDPIVRTAETFRASGILTDALDGEINARVRAAVGDALEYALRAPEPDPSQATRHVFRE